MSFPDFRTRRLGLTTAAAAIAFAVAGTAAAQSMVVRSTGPSASKYPTGAKLKASDKLTLVAGDKIVLMQGGKTRTLSGPGTYGASGPIQSNPVPTNPSPPNCVRRTCGSSTIAKPAPSASPIPRR